ncbi:MAG: CsbD family protein [Candidatus Eisenbacteria bacterium]|uniref:CsbD family protein n=1 Tax=Eiseniibacteriota bacterium TaxID=2212470 RepID=A0A7Y2H1P8_UNCEI|nr:CsbD family protein [Candidatus Eisenbacteria bacterium]
MESHELKGKWTQLRGEIKARWNKLTDDDIDEIRGERLKLVGKLQEKYGWKKEEAERRLDEFSPQWVG